MQYLITEIITIFFLIIATLTDIRTRKIPNILTFGMMLVGCVLHIIFDPTKLISVGVLYIIAFVFAAILPGIGMGDIKLLMGLGSLIDPIRAVIAYGLASILIIILAFAKSPKQVFDTVQLRLLGKKPPSKNTTNSVALAPYLLVSTILAEGVYLLWNVFI